MGTRHFRYGIAMVVAAGAVAVATVASANDDTGLERLNLIRPRASAPFSFEKSGKLVTSGDGWSDPKKYSHDNKIVYFNGPTPGSSRDYIELTKEPGKNPTRAIMFGIGSAPFSELNVAGMDEEKVTTVTRCVANIGEREQPGRIAPAPITCWSLNKPVCEAILKGAGADSTDKLMAKVKECMDLNTTIRKLDQSLIGDLKKQFDEDVKALRMAKEFSPRLDNLNAKFEDPTNMKIHYVWQKFISIAASCQAILGAPSETKTMDDVLNTLGYKVEPAPGMRDGGAPPLVPGRVRQGAGRDDDKGRNVANDPDAPDPTDPANR